MKRVLLDQGLAPGAAALLRAADWDAIHVLEVELDRAEDITILEFAGKTNRTCVTLDHDFHTHLALSRADGPSVILLRVEGLSFRQQADLIERVWLACAAEIDGGAAVSADATSVRVRKLPLR